MPTQPLWRRWIVSLRFLGQFLEKRTTSLFGEQRHVDFPIFDKFTILRMEYLRIRTLVSLLEKIPGSFENFKKQQEDSKIRVRSSQQILVFLVSKNWWRTFSGCSRSEMRPDWPQCNSSDCSWQLLWCCSRPWPQSRNCSFELGQDIVARGADSWRKIYADNT